MLHEQSEHNTRGRYGDDSAFADHEEHRYIQYLDTNWEVQARKAFVDCNQRYAKQVCVQYASWNGHIHMTGNISQQKPSPRELA